tara:strand:+ start:1895 stop:2083 length:189 start_codon:yes stop_codon:yes gene_type:complete
LFFLNWAYAGQDFFFGFALPDVFSEVSKLGFSGASVCLLLLSQGVRESLLQQGFRYYFKVTT